MLFLHNIGVGIVFFVLTTNKNHWRQAQGNDRLLLQEDIHQSG